MNFVADTSVWSYFLRHAKRQQSSKVETLKQGILEGSVHMLGIIRQELLSGIREPLHSQKMTDLLDGFPDLLATREDHLLAAEFFNSCRRKGVQGTHIDFLICAQAVRHELPVLTTDKDFLGYAKHLPVKLI
ncbi:MAG: PIN domain-containing protein [Verrucomicrobia bacterium]|jgi:predicted nucleic acid-binding protein|nr:PIN domain-containing protein [Verrucomicrobiota bacterium]